MNTLFGFKVEQTQAFNEAGLRVPVSVIRVEPNVVVAQKNAEKHGYRALTVAVGHKKHLSKPVTGTLKNLSEKMSPRFIREVKIEATAELVDVGNKISVADVFGPGQKIAVTGLVKGKGYGGVVKRHHFKGGPKTHGQSDRQRRPGSIGQTTTPGRVYKGKRMAGHLGNVLRTVKNLAVFAVKPEENLLLVRGLVPGARGTLLKISKE